MTFLARLFRPHSPPAADAVYAAIVAAARDPGWYRAGGVADTIDGRFDAVALVAALVLLRLEREGDPARQLSADLTDRFIADMDGSLRERGIGDPTVGKQVGHMIAALGGRLGAYRDALAGGDLAAALRRNLYRGATVDPAAVDWSVRRVRALADALARRSLADIEDGRL
ncbi:MAG: ubiquinol-cytochrome C chaperone family protein [Sphingomonadaceae bacterium]|nr:ubiquinol-cytochrome C chaperone family protein [Sphingomonadaceae bacterium]